MDLNRPWTWRRDELEPRPAIYDSLPVGSQMSALYALNNNERSNADIGVASTIDLEQDDIERMDSVYARALQLRELRARNFDDNNMDLVLEPEWPEFLDQILMLDMMDPSDSDDSEDPSPADIPMYPVGPQVHATECVICCEVGSMTLRPCCQLPVCMSCLTQYLTSQVSLANVRIECLSLDCSSYIHRDEVLARLDADDKQKFYKFLVDANQDPHVKTCPRCSHVMTLGKEDLKLSRSLSRGLKVSCEDCNLVWCFPCQAPWHEGIQCREFQKGDKLLRAWAKEQRSGQHNAQRCPRCKVYIQRAAGCDHMICSRCKTNFCYRCGERFRHIKFIGDHYSRLSVFGCRYRFLPDRPVKRKFIRGAILGGKLLAAPVVAGLAVGGAAILLGFGTVAAPFYGGYKLHKMHKRMKRRRAEQELRLPRHLYRPSNPNAAFSDYMNVDYFDLVQSRGATVRRASVTRSLSETRNSLDLRIPVPRVTENALQGRDVTLLTSTYAQVPTVSAQVGEENVTVDGAFPSCPVTRLLMGQDEDAKRTLTTAQVVRQDATGGCGTHADYPMEVLNVVTRYIDESAEDWETDADHGVKDDSKTADAESQSQSLNSTGQKELTAPAKGKLSGRNNGKALVAREPEKTPQDCEILTNNNNTTSSKSHAKDTDGKTISHVPWLNIVCGKISKDKESPAKKETSTGKCPAKSVKSDLVKNENESPDDVNDELNRIRADLDNCTLMLQESVSKLEFTCKSENVGPFGHESDDGEDNISISSGSGSPPQVQGVGHFYPAGHSLEFIDEEYVSPHSEVTCL